MSAQRSRGDLSPAECHSNPAVVISGDGQDVIEKRYQISASSEIEKDAIFQEKRTQAVKKDEKYGIRYCSCNRYYKSYSEMPWWCRSCAFASDWKPPENDVGVTKPRPDNGTSTSERDFPRAETENFTSKRVPDFVNNVSYIKANKNNKEKCSYLKHVVEQAPFDKIPLKIRAAIVLTSPVWLLQMLASPFPIKVISHKKYYSCCEKESFLSGVVGFPPTDNPFVLDGNLEWASVLDILTGAAAACCLQIVLQLLLGVVDR